MPGARRTRTKPATAKIGLPFSDVVNGVMELQHPCMPTGWFPEAFGAGFPPYPMEYGNFTFFRITGENQLLFNYYQSRNRSIKLVLCDGDGQKITIDAQMRKCLPTEPWET